MLKNILKYIKNIFQFIKLYLDNTPHSKFLLEKIFGYKSFKFFLCKLYNHFYKKFNNFIKKFSLENSFILNILGYLILFVVVTFFLNYLTKSINVPLYLNYIHLTDSTGTSSIVELSSIFIGAFVGVLGIILSISYTTVTNNVRRLILNDNYIQFYLKIIIYSLFFITVNYWLFHNNSDICLFIFSIIMIVSFIPIFIYLLELLSPVKNIENNLSRKIKDNIKKATFNGQNSKKILNYFNINCLNHEKELKNRLEVENYL